MLKIEDVNGVKLVTEVNNFASDGDVRNALEGAFVQGSQGWGVSGATAVLLSLARELKAALMLANVADENHRLLKGAQLALGRATKTGGISKAAVDSLTVTVDEQSSQIKSLQQSLDAVRQERDFALGDLEKLDSSE